MTSTNRNMAGHVVGERYMLLSLIAKGGMGEVWKARDQRTGKIVAAKVLRPELSGESLPLNRLRLEAQNTLRIEHPNIAAVYDSGEDNGRGWLVMELVDGRPLTDYLRNGNRIAPAELIPVLIQMSMALGAAAQAGVVHRDIKPANVLIRPNGMVKLTDFGISRTENQVDLTQAGMVMGTAQYLPPEQALGEVATSVGDLYSVGVIAYEACAGKRPFTGKTQVDIAFAHVHDKVPPLPDDVPPSLTSLIMHLLDKEPSKRPQSGQALVRELVSVAKELGVSIDPIPLTLPLSDEQATAAPTRQQPVVAPVHHEPVHHLPAEMLERPDLDEARLDVVAPERPLHTPRFRPVQETPPTAPPEEQRATVPPTEGFGQFQPRLPRPVETPAPVVNSHAQRPIAGRPVAWQPVDMASVRTAAHPPSRHIRTPYSRAVVAKDHVGKRRSHWIMGLAFGLLVAIVMSVLMYILLSSLLPLSPLFGGASTSGSPMTGTAATGFLAYQEAHHV